MDIPLRPLGLLTETVEEAGLNVTYAYDDLVFVQHNVYLLQFTETASMVKLYFNVKCEADKADEMEIALKTSANKRGLFIERSGRFEMRQKEDSEELEVEFLTEA